VIKFLFLNLLFYENKAPMKSFIARSVVWCAVLLSFTSVAQTSMLSRISVSGNKFVAADGKPIIFRGLDTSDPNKLAKENHWNREYFEAMKSWGANIVRFPVHPVAWRLQGRDAYIKLLDQGIAWAGELGMYVIIDWHSIGNLHTEMYQSDMYETTRKETFEFWRTMAKQYKDNYTVAFFELYNEPTVMNGQLGRCTWTQWKELVEEMITIIRANGAKTIPLVAGFNWAYDLTPIATYPIDAEGIAYVSHPYPMKRSKPWEKQWTDDWGFVAEKYPLILTEIGFCGADDKGAHVPVISDESYGEAITKYCSEKGISYTVWVFDPTWSPMLFTDWNFTPSRQGRYFKNALQSGK
jgi:endoglucanase